MLSRGIDYQADDPKGFLEIWNTPPGYLFLGLLGVFAVLMLLVDDSRRKEE